MVTHSHTQIHKYTHTHTNVVDAGRLRVCVCPTVYIPWGPDIYTVDVNYILWVRTIYTVGVRYIYTVGAYIPQGSWTGSSAPSSGYDVVVALSASSANIIYKW